MGIQNTVIPTNQPSFPWSPGDKLDAVPVNNKFIQTEHQIANVLASTTVVVSPKLFGAKVDGVTDDTDAVNAWFAFISTNGVAGQLDLGVTFCNSALVWDLSAVPQGIRIEGQSIGGSILDLRQVVGSVPLLITGGNVFYSDFSNFAVWTNVAGVGVQLGVTDVVSGTFPDALNGFRFSHIEFKNWINDPAAVALQLNGVFNSDFQAVVTNTGGATTNNTGNGVSLELRYTAFNRFFGSFSSAQVGVHLTSFYNFANTFESLDVENVGTAVKIDSVNARRNVFVTGQYGCTVGFDCTAGNFNFVLNPNIALYSGTAYSAGTVGLNLQRLGSGVILDNNAAGVIAALGYTPVNKATTEDVANVLDYGAGVGNDDAAAIRAAIASGKKIILVPPGSYTMKSTVATYGTAVDPSCFEIRGKSDTFIIAYGAVFSVDNSISGPTPVTTLSFTANSKNVGIFGGTFVGNTTGLTSSQENVAINFDSVTALTVRDVKITGTFLAAFSGVYAFDSLFENVQCFNNAIGLDIAHVENLRISHCIFWANPAHAVSGINLHYDVPTLGDNDVTTETGSARSLIGGNTNNFRVLDCVFNGFANGIAIDSGNAILISRTIIRNGLVASSASNLGGILLYNGTAAITASLPLADVTIDDCDIYGNGVTAGGGGGAGVLITASAGNLSDISITNCRIYNNTNTGVLSTSGGTLAGVIISGCDFRSRSGSSVQTAVINSTLLTALKGGAGWSRNNSDRSPIGVDDQHLVANNATIQWQDTSAASQPIIGVSNTNVTFVRPGSTAANIQLQNYAGSALMTVDSGGNSVAVGVPMTAASLKCTSFGANSATPSGKITISGSRGSATATVLASLLQAMVTFGLITDSTTA